MGRSCGLYTTHIWLGGCSRVISSDRYKKDRRQRTKQMKAEELSKNILLLDSKIRFAGLIERTGHMFAGGEREGLEEYLKGRDAELSLSQSAFIISMRNAFSSELGDLKYVIYAHGRVKLFSIPLKEYILALSAENSVNELDLLKKILDYIKSVEPQLTLYPPSNVLDEDKKKTLKNLHESGMDEESIADQLDLDIGTVKDLVKQL
jgi:hypothetical protein